MDLYQIRYFLAIAQIGSFTKAAEQLFVSQPSLSAGIKKLEQELEVILFERGGRRVLLTPAGRLLEEKAKTILAEYQSVRHDLEKLKDRPTLKIGTLYSIRGYTLAQLIGAFREKYPNVAIELCNGYLQDLQDWLEQGNIDLALTWLREQDSPQTSKFLCHQPLSLAVSPSHPFARSPGISLADLDGQSYVRRLNCEFWRTNPKMFESMGIEPQIIYSANNEEWVISLIRAGMGVSIMPIWADLEDIIYVPITDLHLKRTIGWKWRSQRVSEVAKQFQEFVASCHWQI